MYCVNRQARDRAAARVRRLAHSAIFHSRSPRTWRPHREGLLPKLRVWGQARLSAATSSGRRHLSGIPLVGLGRRHCSMERRYAMSCDHSSVSLDASVVADGECFPSQDDLLPVDVPNREGIQMPSPLGWLLLSRSQVWLTPASSISLSATFRFTCSLGGLLDPSRGTRRRRIAAAAGLQATMTTWANVNRPGFRQPCRLLGLRRQDPQPQCRMFQRHSGDLVRNASGGTCTVY